MPKSDQIKQELSKLESMDTELYNESNKLGQLFNKETDKEKRKQIDDKMREIYHKRQDIQSQISKFEDRIRQQKIEELSLNTELQELAAELKSAEADYNRVSDELHQAILEEIMLDEKLDTMNEDDKEYDEISDELDDITVIRQRLNNKLDTKADKVIKLKTKIDKLSNRSLPHQHLAIANESRLFGIPTVRLMLKESEAKLQDRQNEIDKIMNDTNRKLSSLERQYKQAVQECDDDMDCVDDVHSMFEVDMQKVVDRVSKELKQLGVTQFVNELDIPEEFDITE